MRLRWLEQNWGIWTGRKATRFRLSIHTSTFSIRSVRKAFHGPAQRTPCSIGQRFPAGMRSLLRR
jgi:hypothetical protein